MDEGKYKVPKDEGEVLPNKLGLTKPEEIEQSELEGFLYAYKILFADLNEKTKFDLKYILKIHKLALEHLYSFAGKLRTVNISKGGFMFPPAKFLEQTMSEFESKILKSLPAQYDSEEQLIKDIAKVHAELLFIHPFREGNGRASRLLANLMAAKAGHKLLELENFRKEKFDEYVKAIRLAANADYSPMEKIIRSLF
ncbi:MAG: Fic family protein [Bacteroidia bacterium]